MPQKNPNPGIEFERAERTEGPPSIPEIIRQLSGQFITRSPEMGFKVAGKTEDISSFFCFSGTAIDTYDERVNGVSGEFKFTNCSISFGISLDGKTPYEVSWNDTTLDYRLQFGGTLSLDGGIARLIAVFNFIESGNNGTGDYSFTPSFSFEGLPGESYLATTLLAISGNYFSGEVTSGELYVDGADNTRLCMEFTAINTVTVELDDGLGGGCVPLAPPLDISI